MPSPTAPGGALSFTKSNRIREAIVKEISIVDAFPEGYRNREDITNTKEGTLVIGSQNVILNTSSRIQVRQGYAIDGAQLFYIQTAAISSNAVTLDSTSSLATGNYATVTFSSGITGLTSGNLYYVIVINSTQVQFATSSINAIAGTPITISGTPAGAWLSIQKSSSAGNITSSFDFNSMGNGERHLRVGFLDSTGSDGRMQFRWVDANGNVFWSDLLTGLNTTMYNFTTFWDTTELIRECLFVNGSSNVYEWSGAYDTVVSTTSNSITVTNPIIQNGWYNVTTGKFILTIRGVNYTYTGVSGSTFTGVETDPTSGVHKVYPGDIAVQTVYGTANSGITDLPATWANNLIYVLNNQIYYGSLTSPTLYMSKINNYLDTSFSSPRLPGEGATATLDDNIVAFIPQRTPAGYGGVSGESSMYISAGKNFWYNTTLQQTLNQATTDVSAFTTETFNVTLLATNPQQGTQSQALTSKIGNYIVMVTNEPVVDKLGLLESILGSPQTQAISDPIKLDMDIYDFAGGSIFYNKYYLYISIPTLGIVRMYNFNTKAWEAPQTLPITNFYTVEGILYGHSSVTSESYQLFTGYSDRATIQSAGEPYLAVADFAYQNFGVRTVLKSQNKFYMEGYISANTTMNCIINYEQDGNLTQQTFTVLGDDSTAVGLSFASDSLGKNPLGQSGLGTQASSSLTGLPPKFRIIKTFPRFDFFECQFSFSILGVDQQFQLLSFGSNASPSDTTSGQIEE